MTHGSSHFGKDVEEDSSILTSRSRLKRRLKRKASFAGAIPTSARDDRKGGRVNSNALRILMADDNRQEHMLMSMAAESLATPLIFDFVPDGRQLLTELYVPTTLEELPNAIILDLRMPGFNGLCTLAELQDHPMFWQIPVIVYTSSMRRKDQDLSYQRGAVLFENKPTTFGEMQAFLERVVEVATPASEYIGEASRIIG